MINKILIVLILFLLAGCAAQIPKEAEDAFYMNDFGKAAKLSRPCADKLNRNFALNNAKLGQMYFTGGGYDLAFLPFLNAGKVMERTVTGSDNAFWSSVSREDFKEFKGEPFERSMCHWYRGIIHYRRGDYEKALAAFRRGIDADKDTMSLNKSDTSDFSAGYVMAARCNYLLGEPDTADTYIQKSRFINNTVEKSDDIDKEEVAVINDENNDNLEKIYKKSGIDSDNTIFVVEWGDSPLKQRENNIKDIWSCSAFAEYIPRSSKIEYAKIFVDGNEKIQINRCTSVSHQLSCNTEKTAETIQKIKIGAKWTVRVCAFAGAFTGVLIATKGNGTAATAAGFGAALLAGAVVRTEADVRVWDLLPDDIGIGSLDIEPGFHNIAVCFYSSSNSELPEWRQVYYYYPIKRDDNLIYCRTTFDHFGKYKFETEEVSSSIVDSQISSRHYLEIDPVDEESDIRIIPLAPAFWKENEVDNLTIF